MTIARPRLGLALLLIALAAGGGVTATMARGDDPPSTAAFRTVDGLDQFQLTQGTGSPTSASIVTGGTVTFSSMACGEPQRRRRGARAGRRLVPADAGRHLPERGSLPERADVRQLGGRLHVHASGHLLLPVRPARGHDRHGRRHRCGLHPADGADGARRHGDDAGGDRAALRDAGRARRRRPCPFRRRAPRSPLS